MKRRIFKRYRKGKRGGQRYWVKRRPSSYLLYPNPWKLTKKQRQKYDQKLDELESEGNDIGPLLEYEMDMAPGPRRKKYGKEHTKNYGGGPLFGRHLEERGIKIEGTPKEKKVIKRLFERNPELIEKDINIEFKDLSAHAPPKIAAGIYDPTTKSIKLHKLFMTSPGFISKLITPERALKHEIAHSRQIPDSYVQTPRGYIPLYNPGTREYYEIEALLADKLIPQRKRKIPQEQITKSFRHIIK